MATTGYFDAELGKLRQDLSQMGGEVERMLNLSLSALISIDQGLARQAIATDKIINAMENDVTNKTIMLMATNQPVAGDLRFLAASLRMAAELERVGDLAANLSRRAIGLIELGLPDPLPAEIKDMATLAQSMLSGALTSFTVRDVPKAYWVLEQDDQMDDWNRQVKRDMVELIAKNGPLIHWGLEIINTAAHLERLGDHATNLAEEVIYINSGRNIRHSAVYDYHEVEN